MNSNDSASSLLQRKVRVEISYLEIYNEQVNDLLDSNGANLDIREKKGKVVVERLT